MNKITQITKRDIIDILINGFSDKEEVTKYDYYERPYQETIDVEHKIRYNGRLSEINFLKRLYNLSKLPSTDSRFVDAEGDIWQHTVNNDDWDEYWVFTDPRFELSEGSDETFLNFICEIFHPVVRDEQYPWRKFLNIFNELLKVDGYKLYEKNHISGRAVYGWVSVSTESISFSQKDINNYELKHIGRGSYANVYKYKDVHYDSYFVVKRALKDLTPKEMERFKREFETMKQLRSPYIVNVYCYNDDLNEYTMEYMDCTLDEYIRTNNGNLTLDKRKSIVMQIIKAFKYIHSKSILHRDICPKNILIKKYDDANIVKISDFGLVKIPESELTTVNTEYKGYFNDPELIVEGFNTYSLSHEIYALTRVIYYVLTGRTNTQNISNVSLKTFVSKGLHSDKKQRYKDIDEFLAAFLNIQF